MAPIIQVKRVLKSSISPSMQTYLQVWRVDEGSWACLYEPSHSFSTVTSLLFTASVLYVAGVPDESSSWAQTWRDGYAAQHVLGGEEVGEQAALNATGYTVARMSQSPTRFQGKYESWGDSSSDGVGCDGPSYSLPGACACILSRGCCSGEGLLHRLCVGVDRLYRFLLDV